MLAALRRAGSVLSKHARAAACENFRAGADASRLSLEVLRRLSSKLGALCRQSLRGTPTIKPMVRKVQT